MKRKEIRKIIETINLDQHKGHCMEHVKNKNFKVIKELYRQPQWLRPVWPSAEEWESHQQRIELIAEKISRLPADEKQAISLYLSCCSDKTLDKALQDTGLTRQQWFEDAPEGFFHYYTD